MNAPHPSPLARLTALPRLLTGLALALGLASALPAQSPATATVTGRITDAIANAPLAGAEVTLNGTALRTTTDRDGAYTLRLVSAGDYTLNASYLGFDAKSLAVSAAAGQTTRLDLTLGDETVQMEAFRVEGIAQGQARAFNQQRANQNISNILSADAAGQFPDASLADATRRLPGVTVVRGPGEGEGRYVTIRGLNADFNAVSLDGVRVSVSNFDGASRSVPLDVISTQSVETIEVSKAITPDQDADAIGGSIRITSRSAFDRDGRFATAEASLSLNNLVRSYGSGFYLDDTGYRGSFTYGDFLNADQTLGFAVSANLRQSPYVSQSIDTRGYATASGGTAANGGEQYNGLLVPTGVVLQEFLDQIDSTGLNLSLDFRPDSASRYRLAATYSERESRRGRQRQEIRFDSGIRFWNLNRPVTVSGDTVTEFTSDNRLVRQVRDFYEEQELFSVSFEGRREFGDLTAEFRAGFNRGNFDGDAARDLNATFQSGFADNTYRLAEPYTPEFGSTRDRLNPFQFRFVSVDLGTRFITDDEFVLGGDLQRDRELLGGTGFIKVGAQARFRERDYQTLDRFYDDVTNVRRLSGGSGAFAWFADEAPDGGSLATATYGPATSANGAYNYGFFFDPDRTRRIVNSLIADGTIAFNAAGAIDSVARSQAGSYDAEENIYAAYGLAQTTLGQWTLLGGVRAEFTDVSFDTFRATRAGSVFTGTTPLRASNDYVDVLPSVHARYDVNRDFVIRAALSSTLARASYRQLNPSETINTTDRTITRGRTDLDPTSSTNLDLTAEYYFSSIGLISAGVFYKDMSDNIYQLSSNALGATLPGVPESEAGATYEIREFRNAKGAEVFGFEFAFERALRFLPAPFDGLGIFANYTWVDSDVDTGLPGRANLTTPLFEQVEASYNIGAYYEKHGLQIRVAYNWRDGYLAFNGFNADPRLDRYVSDIGQLDITASYRFERLNLTVFTEFINVTDAPDRSYLGNESLRPAYNEYRDWQATFGLRWRL